MMEFGPELAAMLFGVALIAGWIDALAGGGGMLTIPALMLTGMPPATALATNKLQGSFGSFTAAFYFIRKGMVSLRANLGGLLLCCLGSAIGAGVLLRIDTSWLAYVVPILLMGIGLYFLFFAGKLDQPRTERLSPVQFNRSVAPALGFYDGFFGPGTGSFLAASFVGLRGYAIHRATAHAKLFNFASNIASLGYFILFGQIAWLAGGVMIAGQICGAYLGARTVMSGGARLIRPITVLVCFSMSLRLIWGLTQGG